jgi:uncharacterized protein YndB with AHSA1/START domain
MTELRFEADIHAGAERVFGLLADLRTYDRWLPHSSSFNGTTQISDGPIGAGTTYVEPSALGTRYGKVTLFEPPAQLNFEQPMTMKPSAFGIVDIKQFHTLVPIDGGDSVHYTRVVQIEPHGLTKLILPFAIGMIRAENQRTLNALKAYAESEPT